LGDRSLILWVIAISSLLIGALFDFFQAIANLVLSLIPNLLKLGCILSVAIVVAVVYESICEDIKRDE
jgi:type III secretory pathway component EscS